MKYLYICLLSILVVLSLQSCKRGMSPNDYNELVVTLHESSWQYFQDKSSELYDNEIHGDTSKNIIDSIGFIFDTIIETLDSIKYPREAHRFHQATIKLFEYVRDSVIPLYTVTLDYKPESYEWYKAWNDIDSIFRGRVSQLENSLIEEQIKFAEKVSINY